MVGFTRFAFFTIAVANDASLQGSLTFKIKQISWHAVLEHVYRPSTESAVVNVYRLNTVEVIKMTDIVENASKSIRMYLYYILYYKLDFL